MKKFKCAKCGNEYKGDFPPSKCEVLPDCIGASFFIDLPSYGQLEVRCNQLQEKVNILEKFSEIEEVIPEIKDLDSESLKSSAGALRGTLITKIRDEKTKEKSSDFLEKLSSSSEELQKQIKILYVEKEKLISKQRKLEIQIKESSSLPTELEQSYSKTKKLKAEIASLEKRKKIYKWLFIVFFILSIIFLFILFNLKN